MIFKIVFGVTCAIIGRAMWRQAAQWKAEGVVPPEWNDGVAGKVRRDGPDIVIGFHKGLAILMWLFSLICVVSLIFVPEL